MDAIEQSEPQGLVVRVTRVCLQGPQSVLLIAAALLMELVALLAKPQEEEPQIVVPMADVFVDEPGRTPREVEYRHADKQFRCASLGHSKFDTDGALKKGLTKKSLSRYTAALDPADKDRLVVAL